MISIVRFHHLTYLDLASVHVDYVRQFLFDKNTYLPRLITLPINYQQLVEVTDNFTSDAARNNCACLKERYTLKRIWYIQLVSIAFFHPSIQTSKVFLNHGRDDVFFRLLSFIQL
jgi:hypothetical protein